MCNISPLVNGGGSLTKPESFVFLQQAVVNEVFAHIKVVHVYFKTYHMITGTEPSPMTL
jgi:hypothetical protein